MITYASTSTAPSAARNSFIFLTPFWLDFFQSTEKRRVSRGSWRNAPLSGCDSTHCRAALIAEPRIVRDAGFASRTGDGLLYLRATLIAEPRPLRQYGIAIHTNDLRRTRNLSVHRTPPCCTALHPRMSSLARNTTSPVPGFPCLRDVLGGRACDDWKKL